MLHTRNQFETHARIERSKAAHSLIALLSNTFMSLFTTTSSRKPCHLDKLN